MNKSPHIKKPKLVTTEDRILISLGIDPSKDSISEGGEIFKKQRDRLLSFVKPVYGKNFYESVFAEFKTEREKINFFSFVYGLRVFSNYNHRALKSSKDTFVKISRNFIRTSMTSLARDYSKFLDKMIKAEFIECNNSYSVGNYSLGYRFGPKMKDLQWERADYKSFLKEIAPQTGHKQVFQRLPQRFQDSIIHWSAAKTNWIREVCAKSEELGQNLSVVYPPDFYEMASKIAEEKYETYLNRIAEEKLYLSMNDFLQSHIRNLDKINNGFFSVFIDENGFSLRLFSEITSLPAPHRKHLRYNGEVLTNVDLRCAQCCLLAALYDDSPESQEERKSFIFAMQNPNEDFYSLLARRGGLTREQVKTDIFIIMFAPNHQQRGKICKEFNRLFPILTKLIAALKESDHRNVARIMQNKESKIVIELSLRRLFELNIPCFSIHDSIMTTSPYIQTVKDHISAAFSEVMGFSPVLKVD
jgi:hypothetical protein